MHREVPIAENVQDAMLLLDNFTLLLLCCEIGEDLDRSVGI